MRWRTGLSSIMSGSMRSDEPPILTNALARRCPIKHRQAPPTSRASGRGHAKGQRNRKGPGRQPLSEYRRTGP